MFGQAMLARYALLHSHSHARLGQRIPERQSVVRRPISGFHPKSSRNSYLGWPAVYGQRHRITTWQAWP